MSCMRCLCGRTHVLYALSLWEDSCLVCVVFVGGLMSCMRCLCGRTHVLYAVSLWEDSCLVCVVCICLRVVVSGAYCAMFLFCFSSCCVTCVASFSGLSFFYFPSVFSGVYLYDISTN
jgi:hypothetical protein